MHVSIKTLSTLFFLFCLLKPFYWFNSGLPQISDLFLILFFIMIFFLKELTIESHDHNFLTWGMLFVFYVCLLNGIWSIYLGGELDLVLHSLWYVYNFTAAVASVFLHKKMGQDLFRLVYYSIVISVFVQFCLLFFFINSGGFRQTLFFNNPNQLGYFGLLSLALLLVVSQKIKIRYFWFLLSVVAVLALIVLSLSKAAILSAGVMFAIYLIFTRNNKAHFILLISTVLIGSLYLWNPDLLREFSLIKNLETRLSYSNESDNSLSARGYDRIFSHPESIILGAGEGAESRFDSLMSLEVHSTFGNLIFSYGLVGFIFFMLFIIQAVYKRRFSVIYPLFCVFLYGLTHNGIRHTFFWILIALIFVTAGNRDGSKGELS